MAKTPGKRIPLQDATRGGKEPVFLVDSTYGNAISDTSWRGRGRKPTGKSGSETRSGEVEASVTVSNKGTALEPVRYDHDAFGVVRVSKSQGTPRTLFGSALRHQQTVDIELSRAHLNRDWVHGEETIVRWSMSETQWARFVASQGDGTGTPVTLEYAPPRGGGIARMPGLVSGPAKKTFEDELRESLREASAAAQAALAEMGKPGAKPPTKKDLEALSDLLRHGGKQFEGNMAFVQRSFAESMEKTVEAAKTEVEAFVANLAMRTGLEALRHGTAPTLIEGGDGHETIDG
jgi:hypothetical protein